MRRSEPAMPGEGTPGLILEGFDYTRVGEHLAVAQVQAGLTGERDEPATAELFVRGGQSLRLHFPLQSGRTERRLCAGGNTEQLWRGLFTIPAAFAGRSGIVFELSIDGDEPITLPFPFQRPREPRDLELMPLYPESPRVGSVQLKQAVALATAVAVTASSTPAAALASVARSPGHHHVAQDRITTVAAAPGSARGKKASSASTASTAAGRVSAAKRRAAIAPSHPATQSRSSTTDASNGQGGAGCSTSGPEAVIASAGGTSCTAPAKSHRTVTEGLGRSYSHVPAAEAPKASRPATPDPSPTPAATQAPPAAPVTSPTPGTTTNGTPSTQPAGGTVVAGPSGGVAAGTAGAISTPAPATTTPQTPTKTPPTTSPAAARVKKEPASHRGLPVNPPRSATGGSAVAPLGGLTPRPPIRLTGVSTTPSPPALVSTPPGFLGPTSWTGTATNDPALQRALGNLSQELDNADRPPRFLIPIYMEAGRHYHVPWEVLAAINSIESDYGRNLNTSTAGAIGWMQFEPSTWERYGVAADGHSVPNPYDPRDAIFSAAKYLAAAGAEQDLWGSVYAYNHASWYVNMVLTRARAIAAAVRPQNQTLKRGVISVFFAAFAPHHRLHRIRYRGGVLSHYDRLISAANMVSAADFPYVWGGGHEQPARFGPFDCSGSVSYVMQQAGYKVATTVSGTIPIWKFPAGPGRVTIFYNAVHTFMRIGNRYFGTSGFARPGGGAGWFSTNQIPVSYLDQFSEVHVPHLGVNSFAPPHRHHRA